MMIMALTLKEKYLRLMNDKEKLKNYIKEILKEWLEEAGPNVQGLKLPWLGPTIPDETGIPSKESEDLDLPQYPQV